MRHELFDVIESDEIRQCPHCKAKVSGRPNKIYCSSNCRKRATEMKSNSQFSPTKRRENTEFFERALRLAASNYCKMFWRANIKDVVFCKVPEPETGEC